MTVHTFFPILSRWNPRCMLHFNTHRFGEISIFTARQPPFQTEATVTDCSCAQKNRRCSLQINTKHWLNQTDQKPCCWVSEPTVLCRSLLKGRRINSLGTLRTGPWTLGVNVPIWEIVFKSGFFKFTFKTMKTHTNSYFTFDLRSS